LKEFRTKLSVLKKVAHKERLTRDNLVMPIIITEKRFESPNYLITIPLNSLVTETQKILELGISRIMIFGIPKKRNAEGSEAWNSRGIIQRALRKIKNNFGDRVEVITDLCVCQYNLSGHCGTSNSQGLWMNNDRSLINIKRIALSHAEAGSDVVAPSSMMDGQVATIRSCFEEHGFKRVKIMSLATKYASSLYLPFRSTAFANSPGKIRFDKSSYQSPYPNFRESLNEIQMDLEEGADMIMIKPSMTSSDLIIEAKRRFGCPLAVQNVSGEYFMVRSSADKGFINESEWMLEYVISMRRAGADLIMSYGLKKIIEYLD
jgi:porphobilinogen synthase